ncbi:hypothetical protein HYDPIDRAFT_168459 [Hydnomerulius pinastri MD-312]|uniref:RING-type domain-containing protein n=1 Tax=Hydnomerulius pinastri MD-312 TaxID=994086 RepID=A0A0C9VDU9_9AGAM|nr:hypothetical protein HYDPIDRAFT_168459 [Hydnomerulius pinastri MD-312]
MSDAESAPKDPKKQRIDSSPETSTKRDSNRDTKRRRKKKKKAPIVSGASSKNDATPSRADERPLSQRAPLSARNEIIRFTSAAPEADPESSTNRASDLPMQGSSSSVLIALNQSGEPAARNLDDSVDVKPVGETMPSSPRGKSKIVPLAEPASNPSADSLEDKVTQLTKELQTKNELIASHQTLLSQVQQAITCQICLDLMYKPYALAPCGHLACYDCLVQWFKAPPPDNRPAPPAIVRKKTCPHCRAVVRERPIEVWGVKGIAQSVGKSGLAPIQIPAPVDPPEHMNANADPWGDIFPKASALSGRRFPWFFPGADIDDDDDDIPIPDFAPRGEDVGMLDMEDGGIYRCLDCMHEIWDGVCTSCGRVYPGHRHDGDEDEEDEIGWLDEQMGAEEVDMADDPGWMGLEGGDGDDDGDEDEDIGLFAPWEHRMRLFGGPFGFMGAVHVDIDEDEEEEGEGDDLHVSDGGGEGSGDDEEVGYESSFIDDEDDVGVPHAEDLPRIYEIPNDSEDEGEDDDYVPNRRRSVIEILSDEQEDEQSGEEEVHVRRRAAPTRSRSTIVLSMSEDEDELDSDAGHRRARGLVNGGGGGGGGSSRRSHIRRAHGRGVVESDDSEVEFVSDDE